MAEWEEDTSVLTAQQLDPAVPEASFFLLSWGFSNHTGHVVDKILTYPVVKASKEWEFEGIPPPV